MWRPCFNYLKEANKSDMELSMIAGVLLVIAHISIISGCEKWKTGCFDCPQKNNYSKSIFLDKSKENYKTKKNFLRMLRI